MEESKVVDEMGSADEEFAHSEIALFSTLPRNDQWGLLQYKGFWMWDYWLSPALAVQRRFVTRPDDIFVASAPKSGTTWLKALLFSTVHRHRHHPGDPHHPIRTSHPQECVQNLETAFSLHRDPDLDSIPPPRIWSVHTPYSILPESLRRSPCRMVYVARDPKDSFVSLMCFLSAVKLPDKLDIPVDEAFELYCSGISPFGPVWEHALEYWKESLKRPEKVLFLKYEDMKGDPLGSLKRLAEFLGCPFSEEEKDWVVGEISELCSIKSLKEVEANKAGVLVPIDGITVRKDAFFRRGEVGDWKNYLNSEMAQRLDQVIQERLQGSGLKL